MVKGMMFSKCPTLAENVYRYYRRLILAVCLIVAAGGKIYAQTWYSQDGGTVTQSNKLYYATLADTVGIYVYNSGIYTLTNSHIWKTGNTSNTDSSSFYGRNASVLAKNGTITMSNDSITSSGIGVNGAFACFAGASLILTNDTISSAGDYSHGIEATVEATITATNCIIKTTGGIGASAIATDCGGGIINVFGGSATTSLLQATPIYSTGTVTASGTTLTAIMENGSVIDGKNSIALTNCTVTAALNGIKVYESAPDTATGKAHYTMDGGSITSTGHAIYVDGNNGGNAIVLIKGGAILSPATGNIVYTDSGANLVFTADSETLIGNIFADSTALAVDTLSTTLQNETVLNGMITRSSVTIDATSAWNLTSDSHIETMNDASGVNTTLLTVSNITGNGYSVYYKPSLTGNAWLGGNTYSLASGGCLLPEGAVCNTTGVKTVAEKQDKISIYPNPVTDALLVSYPLSDANASVKVMSMDGRIVVAGALENNAMVTVMDVKDIVPGFYLLVVEGNNGKQVIKFRKE